jgi:hypothetical protein
MFYIIEPEIHMYVCRICVFVSYLRRRQTKK